MKGIRMQGGIPLQGKVRIQGSKNAALPILAATLLTNEVSYIQNCPRIADVHRFVHLLRELGCLVHWQEKGIRVQPGENEELPCERAEARRGKLSPECVHLCACWEHCWEDVVM